VLLLDGHFSHLSIESLFLAAKNRIVVLCLPSHTTSILQPNDRSANKQFKANLDKELEEQVALDLLVENRDIASFVLRGLKNKNMSHAVSISWKQTGLFPLDSLKSVGEVKKYQVKQQKQKEQKRLDELADIVLERGNKKKKFEEEKEKRKVESGKIVFGTKQVRCLSSPECLARLQIHREWVSLKNLKKSELVQRLKEDGIANEEITELKVMSRMQDRAQVYLLEKEGRLTELYEKELRSVQEDIPKHLDEFLRPTSSSCVVDDPKSSPADGCVVVEGPPSKRSPPPPNPSCSSSSESVQPFLQAAEGWDWQV